MKSNDKRINDTKSVGELFGAPAQKVSTESSTSPVCYFRLHNKNTRKEMDRHCSEYNEKLKEELEKKFPAKSDSKEYKDAKKQFEETKIKGTTRAVLGALLDMYSAHLKTQAKIGFVDGVFKANNVGIGTHLNKTYSRATVYRHILRLMDAKVIVNKKFRGSNSSFEIEFNPELLVADVSNELIDQLRASYMAQTKKDHVPFKENVEIMAVKPSFSQFPKGHFPLNGVSFCVDTVHGSFQEHKINYKRQSFDNRGPYPNHQSSSLEIGEPTVSKPSLPQEHGSIELSCQSSAGSAAGDSQKEKSSAKKEKGKAGPANNYNQLAEICYNLALSIMLTWNKKHKDGHISPHQAATAKRFIADYILKTVNEGHPPQTFINHFCLVLANQQRWLNRCNYAFLPFPDLYFDPNFKCDDGSPAGFQKAEIVYLNNFKKWQDKNKDYNVRMKEVCKLYREYSENPSYERYRTSIQRLGKLGDSKYLDLFNECVSTGTHLSKDHLHQLWRKEMDN